MKTTHRPLLLLLLLTAAVYLATAGAEFVWDDQWLIVTNTRFQQASLAEILTGDLWAGTGLEGSVSYYRPVLQLTFWIDRELFGLHPAGWHLHSLLWHLLAVAMLYRMLIRLRGPAESTWVSSRPDPLGGAFPALAGALLFALHPVQSEAVAWVAGRNDPLAAAFMMAAVLLLLPREGGVPASRVVGGALCYVAALLSKESTVFMPLLLLLLEVASSGRPGKGAVVRYGALAVGLGAVLALRAALEVTTLSLDPDRWRLALERLPTIAGTYGLLIVKPWPLIATRYLQYLPPGMSPDRIAGVAVLLALPILALLVRDRRRRALAFTGLFGAALTFAPAVVAIVLSRLMGERYLYLPLAWLGLFLAAIIPDRRWTRVAASALALGALAILHVRLPEWHDDLSLFEADAIRAPHCVNQAWRARSLIDRREPAQALEVLDQALEADRTCLPGWQAAMAAGMALRDYPRVVAMSEAARKTGHPPVSESPVLAGSHALALALLGRWDEAVAVAAPAAGRLPMGQAALVVAAQAWRTGDEEAWAREAARWPDRPRMEVWVARLLRRAGETAALERLVARGVDPKAPVGELQMQDPPRTSSR